MRLKIFPGLAMLEETPQENMVNPDAKTSTSAGGPVGRVARPGLVAAVRGVAQSGRVVVLFAYS